MYKKTICIMGMVLLSIQFIIINYPIKKNQQERSVFNNYENIYDDFYYLKSLKDINVLEVKNENGLKGSIEIKGDIKRISEVLKRLKMYKISNYKIEKDEKIFSVLLDIKKE